MFSNKNDQMQDDHQEILQQRERIKALEGSTDQKMTESHGNIGKSTGEDSQTQSTIFNSQRQDAKVDKKRDDQNDGFAKKHKVKICVGAVLVLALIGTVAYFIFFKNETLPLTCREDQLNQDGKCVRKCQQTYNSVWNAISKLCQEECPLWWQKGENGECKDRCPQLQSYDRYNKTCISIYDLNERNSLFLKSLGQQVASKMIGNLNNPLTCKNEAFSTPYSKKLINLENHIYVEVLTRDSLGSDSYSRYKMLMPYKSYETLSQFVDTNDTTTNQCTSTTPKSCSNQWLKIDYYYIQDEYYDNGKWYVQNQGQKKDGKEEGFSRNIFYSDTGVYWNKNGQINGKSLKFANNQCFRNYYSNGSPDGTWTGNDMSSPQK